MNSALCPLPLASPDRIVLAHGSGGLMTSELLRDVFLPAFDNEYLRKLEDQAVLPLGEDARLAFTTDSFVVRPIFFPGGDIGKLAVHGTVNDLAVGGAHPLFISAAFIIEEGLSLDELKQIVASMRDACRDSGVTLVTGDTKVVDRGKGDKVFITTSGIGLVPKGRELSIANAKPDDQILVSGTLGDHGIAILSVREGLSFESEIRSDAASLHSLAEAVLSAGGTAVRCMRDPTRGGLAGCLHDLATASHVGVRVEEPAMPVKPDVRAACEILGLDLLYVANEGKLVAVVAPDVARRVLEAVRAHPLGRDAALIGEVTEDSRHLVRMRSSIGGERIVTLLAGEQLPRIC